MATKTNARTVKASLEDGLKSDAKILGSFGKVAAFAAAALSGEPLSAVVALGKIGETASAAIEGAGEVTRRLGGDASAPELSALSNFERFKAVFYTACSRSFIESIATGTVELTPPQEGNQKKRGKPQAREVQASLKEKLQMGVAKLSEAEVGFLFGMQPLAGSVPLFAAYAEWTTTALLSLGFDESTARSFAVNCEKQARERFRVFLTGDDVVADWMRRYLAIARDEQIGELVGGLTTIADSLRDWTEPVKELRRREEEAWARYREMLMALPDMKETMFNEQFGVRKVFVKPEVTYHVAGAVGDSGKPQKAADIGHLLGALISTRTTGEDLIILCGGPGSGKSTLCRIFAAQLATDAGIHPIFIRLRRLKEGLDIGTFIEDSLQKLGAISRLSDLKEFPNLVVILDGFDELVMASRARLRQFFNVLREEHSTGSLRGAKIVVSGRDTLFPQGEGLPNGSHVVTLQPFDGKRVELWCEKWRAMHTDGPGSTFDPAQFLDANSQSAKTSPLHHLVSWPLTLHLVARVHTTGLLNLGGGKAAAKIEKAYLYRSILLETAQRQEGQADTAGRLKPEKMREFLRDLAWHMYSESRDSMDPSEVMPLLGKYFKDSSDAELAELADVAVVNSPELSKGEETGFEFVHKSFSEYLVAERMAYSLELAIYRAPTFENEELTWRMSDEDAARELSPYLGTRLLTEEVQEMLEPMLGSFRPFLKGGKVSEVVSGRDRFAGLKSVVSRLEGLLRQSVSGEHFRVVVSAIRGRQAPVNPLEVFANYCAGVMLVGAAAARQIQLNKKSESESILFDGNPAEGHFWRLLSIISAGGLQYDRKLASRLFRGVGIKGGDGRTGDDRASPMKLGWLSQVSGYRSSLSDALGDLHGYVAYLQFFLIVFVTYQTVTRTEMRDVGQENDMERMLQVLLRDVVDSGYARTFESFVSAGLLSDMVAARVRPDLDYLLHSLARGRPSAETAYRLDRFVHELGYGFGRFGSHRPAALVEMMRHISERDPGAFERTIGAFLRYR